MTPSPSVYSDSALQVSIAQHCASENNPHLQTTKLVKELFTNTEMEVTTFKKNVRFAEADIVEFEPTVWTATVASEGVPVGLSVNVRRRTRRRLDSYENERCGSRVNRQEYMERGYLEPEERLDILEVAGHSNAILSHVECESIRVNRERWENNEYDLMYQFGLGETAIMDLSEDEYDHDSHYDLSLFQEHGYSFSLDDDQDMNMFEIPNSLDSTCGVDDLYYTSSKQDSDVRSAITIMDAYDTRYDDWAWNYTTDYILSETEADRHELPYAKDTIDLPNLRFMDLSDMSTSPRDISTSDCMMTLCASVHFDSKRTLSTPSSSNKSTSPIAA